jgi:hypothetical protein
MSIFSFRPVVLLVAFLGTVYSIKGQTGPAGVGNSSTNRVWLDASRLTGYSNAAKVNQWTDASGNNLHARQANELNKPTLQTNVLNGKPVIRFDRTAAIQYLDITTPGIGAAMSNSRTLFVVAQAHTGGTGTGHAANQAVFLGVGYHSGIVFIGYPATTQAGAYQVTRGSTFQHPYVTATAGQNTWHLVTNPVEETPSGTTNSMYLNGNYVNAAYSPLQLVTRSDLVRVGTGDLSGQYQWSFNGDAAEIILFDVQLNAAQRIIVENYLSAKYNLSIANKYYSDNTHYNQDVQGIGTTNGTVKHSQAAHGKGLILTEANNSLNGPAAEFLFAGHNAATNAWVTTDLPAAADLERWQRSWYVHKTGTIEARLAFDWSEGGLAAGELNGDSQGYVLLYRPDLQSSFRPVSADNAVLVPVLENTDQLSFTLGNASLQNGYYTLGKLDAFVWTGAVSSDWHLDGNWSGNRVPAAGDPVVVPACTTCPVLAADVAVGSLLVEGGQLDVRHFTFSAAAATRLISARILSNGGTLQAASLGEVKGCNFEGNIVFRKTGSTDDAWYGDNAYRGKVTVLNAGTGSVAAAVQANDVIVK